MTQITDGTVLALHESEKRQLESDVSKLVETCNGHTRKISTLEKEETKAKQKLVDWTKDRCDNEEMVYTQLDR